MQIDSSSHKYTCLFQIFNQIFFCNNLIVFSNHRMTHHYCWYYNLTNIVAISMNERFIFYLQVSSEAEPAIIHKTVYPHPTGNGLHHGGVGQWRDDAHSTCRCHTYLNFPLRQQLSLRLDFCWRQRWWSLTRGIPLTLSSRSCGRNPVNVPNVDENATLRRMTTTVVTLVGGTGR